MTNYFSDDDYSYRDDYDTDDNSFDNDEDINYDIGLENYYTDKGELEASSNDSEVDFGEESDRDIFDYSSAEKCNSDPDEYSFCDDNNDSEDDDDDDDDGCQDSFNLKSVIDHDSDVRNSDSEGDDDDDDDNDNDDKKGLTKSKKNSVQKEESIMKSGSRKRNRRSNKKSTGRPSKKQKVESTSKVSQQSEKKSRQNKKVSNQNKKSSKKNRKKRPHVKISAGAIRKFSANHVKIPKHKMKWARKMANDHIQIIRSYFKTNKDAKDAREIFSHFEFTGSFYERLKSQDADELDILVVLDTKNNADLVVEEVVPGYARIKVTDESSKYWKFVDSKGYLNPVQIRSWFFGHVQKAINNYDKLKQEKDPELKLLANGPATTLSIDDKENHWQLKVDLVPAFLFKPKKDTSTAVPIRGRRYVPKPLPEDDDNELKDELEREMLWRQSFSFEEKKKMEKMDAKDQGCRREVVKVIKTIRENDKTLRGQKNKLSSYHIKTAFLHYNFGEGQENLEWSGKHLPERFLGLMDYLKQRISEKKLSHFFINELNLLEEFSDSSLNNIGNRLSNLISNEKELKKALKQLDNKKSQRRNRKR